LGFAGNSMRIARRKAPIEHRNTTRRKFTTSPEKLKTV